MLSPLILTAVLAAPVALPSETLEQRWRVVLFDGQKVGHALSERQRLGERYVSREVMDLELWREGEPVRLYSEQVVQESLALAPLAFSVRMKSSAAEQRVDGTVLPDGRVRLKIDSAGSVSERELAMPAGALLAEAQLARLRDSGLKAGSTIEFTAFEPSLLEAIRVETQVLGPRRVAVLDQDRELIEVLQTAHFPGNPVQTRAWVDAGFTPYRLSMNLLGMQIEMVDCSRSCALAPNQPVDYLQRLLLTPPAALPPQALDPGLRYTLAVDGEGRIGSTSEQRVAGSGETLTVEVCGRCDGESAAEPGPEWLAPTPWIQSADPLIVRMAKEAASGADTPRERMRAAEAYVRRYIRNKNLSVGYASALETAQSRSGDCTEHALLLAALGRALGVPTRVATGLAYAEGYGESGRAFVPHAWTQAWIDGRWQSFDAALDGFDAGHLALAVGDGDPSRFYAGISLLGRLSIREVTALTGTEVEAP
jgi:hypothetical protein